MLLLPVAYALRERQSKLGPLVIILMDHASRARHGNIIYQTQFILINHVVRMHKRSAHVSSKSDRLLINSQIGRYRRFENSQSVDGNGKCVVSQMADIAEKSGRNHRGADYLDPGLPPEH